MHEEGGHSIYSPSSVEESGGHEAYPQASLQEAMARCPAFSGLDPEAAQALMNLMGVSTDSAVHNERVQAEITANEQETLQAELRERDNQSVFDAINGQIGNWSLFNERSHNDEINTSIAVVPVLQSHTTRAILDHIYQDQQEVVVQPEESFIQIAPEVKQGTDSDTHEFSLPQNIVIEAPQPAVPNVKPKPVVASRINDIKSTPLHMFQHPHSVEKTVSVSMPSPHIEKHNKPNVIKVADVVPVLAAANQPLVSPKSHGKKVTQRVRRSVLKQRLMATRQSKIKTIANKYEIKTPKPIKPEKLVSSSTIVAPVVARSQPNNRENILEVPAPANEQAKKINNVQLVELSVESLQPSVSVVPEEAIQEAMVSTVPEKRELDVSFIQEIAVKRAEYVLKRISKDSPDLATQIENGATSQIEQELTELVVVFQDANNSVVAERVKSILNDITEVKEQLRISRDRATNETGTHESRRVQKLTASLSDLLEVLHVQIGSLVLIASQKTVLAY